MVRSEPQRTDSWGREGKLKDPTFWWWMQHVQVTGGEIHHRCSALLSPLDLYATGVPGTGVQHAEDLGRNE